jgi:hypothetical protein
LDWRIEQRLRMHSFFFSVGVGGRWWLEGVDGWGVCLWGINNSNDWENLRDGCLKIEQSVRKNMPIGYQKSNCMTGANEIPVEQKKRQ